MGIKELQQMKNDKNIDKKLVNIINSISIKFDAILHNKIAAIALLIFLLALPTIMDAIIKKCSSP